MKLSSIMKATCNYVLKAKKMQKKSQSKTKTKKSDGMKREQSSAHA